MGVCASCLRGRDRKQPSTNGETQPLLVQDQDADNDLASDNPDDISVRRHEELDQIVHATLDYFIDMSAVPNNEPGEQLDVSALAERLAERQHEVTLSIPTVSDLTDAERELFEKDLQELDA